MAKKETDLNVGNRTPAEDDAVLTQIIADAEEAGNTVETREDDSVWITTPSNGLSVASRIK